MSERPLRKHARRKLEASAEIEILGKKQECLAREISEGGLFVVVDHPLAVGSKTKLNLNIGNETLNIDGEVVYAVSKDQAQSEFREPGMGIRFINLQPEVIKKITSLIF